MVIVKETERILQGTGEVISGQRWQRIGQVQPRCSRLLRLPQHQPSTSTHDPTPSSYAASNIALGILESLEDHIVAIYTLCLHSSPQGIFLTLFDSPVPPNSSPVSHPQETCLRHQPSRSAPSRPPTKRLGRTSGPNTTLSTSAPSPKTSQKPHLIVSSTRRIPSTAR